MWHSRKGDPSYSYSYNYNENNNCCSLCAVAVGFAFGLEQITHTPCATCALWICAECDQASVKLVS